MAYDALEAQTPRAVFIGSGTRGPFTLQDTSGNYIRVRTQSHLRVRRYTSVTDETGTLLTLNTDFTVNNTDIDAVTVTLTSAQTVLASTERLVVERLSDIADVLSLAQGGDFSGPALADSLKILAEQMQDLRRDVDRSPRMDWRETVTQQFPIAPTSGLALLGRSSTGAIVHATAADFGDGTPVNAQWLDIFAQDPDEVLDDFKGVRVVQTYAQMTALSAAELTDNCEIITQGRASERDGGEGRWIYDAASTTTANGGTILAIDGGGAGRFFRIRESDRVVWVQWFGDLTTASGFTAAWQAATTAAGVGGEVHIPYGGYTINGAITPLAAQHHIGHGKPIITKAANITNLIVMTQAPRARIEGLYFEGAGATYTGKGVYIGAHADSYEQEVFDCIFNDFAGPCVHFDGADAGQRAILQDSYFRCTTVTDPAILGTTTVDTGGNRQILNCFSSGGKLVAINKMFNTSIEHCNCSFIDFSGSDGIQTRARLSNCRIANLGGDLEVYGNDNALVGNIIAGGLILMGAASRNHISGNVLAASEVPQDESTATGDNCNWIDHAEFDVTVTLVGSGSNPTSSANTARATRFGKELRISGEYTFATAGTNSYSITIPSPLTNFVAKARASEQGWLYDASTGFFHPIVCKMAAGGAVITFADALGPLTHASPIAVAAGDILFWQVTYELS